MTSRAKRLTLILGVAALIAVITGSVLRPEPAAAAKKPRDPDAFTIAVTLRETTWSTSGSFTATGAIEDSGAATAPSAIPHAELALQGESGDIYISLNNPVSWQFTIAMGTGAYADLSGSGTYTFDVRRKKNGTATWEYTLDGLVGP